MTDFSGLMSNIGTAEGLVRERANATVDKMRRNRGVTWDNADQVDSWDGRWFKADKESLNQLNMLRDAISSGDWTSSLDRQAETTQKAQEAQAGEGFRQAETARRTGSARAGTSAGSWEAVQAQQNAQNLAYAKAQVGQQVAELKAAGVQNLNEMGQQLLSSILGGVDDNAAQASTLASDQVGTQAAEMQNQIGDQYRDLLAKTMAGGLGAISGGVTAGFNYAQNANTAQRQQYQDDINSGLASGSFGNWQRQSGNDSKSWWGF